MPAKHNHRQYALQKLPDTQDLDELWSVMTEITFDLFNSINVKYELEPDDFTTIMGGAANTIKYACHQYSKLLLAGKIPPDKQLKPDYLKTQRNFVE